MWTGWLGVTFRNLWQARLLAITNLYFFVNFLFFRGTSSLLRSEPSLRFCMVENHSASPLCLSPQDQILPWLFHCSSCRAHHEFWASLLVSSSFLQQLWHPFVPSACHSPPEFVSPFQLHLCHLSPFLSQSQRQLSWTCFCPYLKIRPCSLFWLWRLKQQCHCRPGWFISLCFFFIQGSIPLSLLRFGVGCLPWQLPCLISFLGLSSSLPQRKSCQK